MNCYSVLLCIQSQLVLENDKDDDGNIQTVTFK